MCEQENTAVRLVEGRELHLRRRNDSGWEVKFYDTSSSSRRSDKISELFSGETFASPDHAAAACRRLVVL